MTHPGMSIKQRIFTKSILWMRGRKCHLCGGAIYRFSHATLDHIITKSAGGSDDLDNLALAHEPCNGLRGDMTMEQWASQT